MAGRRKMAEIGSARISVDEHGPADPALLDPDVLDPEVFDPDVLDPEVFDSDVLVSGPVADLAGVVHLSDTDLLRRHVAGDPDAFGVLFLRHKDRLWAVALRTVADPED